MWLIGLILVYSIVESGAQTTAGRAIFEAAADERINRDLREPCDQDNVFTSYDFIIVGAGAAGATLASRLTENPSVTVLLIEAGKPEPAIASVPGFSFYLRKSDIDWGYSSEPDENYCRGMENGSCPIPVGKTMGGSTVVNEAISTRGNRRDYDLWEALGNSGWGYNSILPYFKKLETQNSSDHPYDPLYHGYEGPIETGRPFTHPLFNSFIEAGRETGWPVNQDYNAATQIGYSLPLNVIKDGATLSSSRAYLHPIRNRANLHVTKYSLAREILFDTWTQARGVSFEKDNKLYNVFARREVIICAGAINSPKLLMLSGIGPRDHLLRKGISPVRVDLPVGENLQDHVGLLSGIKYETNITNPTVDLDRLIDLWKRQRAGPLTSSSNGVGWSLLDTTQPGKRDGWADVEIIAFHSDNNPEILRNIAGISKRTYDELYPQPSENHVLINLIPILLRPKSRGKILLRDADPRSKPMIYPNYWKDPEDLRTLIRGVREIIKLGGTSAYKALNATLRTNRPRNCIQSFMSDAYVECMCKELTFTIYHYVGTCGMGTVVDESLKVKGIRRLRVVDASVMPTIPTGHTLMPTYMIAEKAADLIKREWGLLSF